jgi:glyoxylase-like metal-dependent hydrolase (beta-lactamase superfamily II)
MSEPKARAHETIQVVPGVHRWSISDERIGGGPSEAYALVADDGTVTLIDPLPIDEEALRQLGRVEAIVLTAGNHQRSAWRFRKRFQAPVWAPEGAQGLEEKPDASYAAGDSLPGGLMPFQTPGPTEAMYALWLERPRSVIFLSDLLTHEEEGTPRFVDSAWQEQPERTRLSIQRIIDHLPVEVLCFAHGHPVLRDGLAVLRRALEEDPEHLTPPTPP